MTRPRLVLVEIFVSADDEDDDLEAEAVDVVEEEADSVPSCSPRTRLFRGQIVPITCGLPESRFDGPIAQRFVPFPPDEGFEWWPRSTPHWCCYKSRQFLIDYSCSSVVEEGLEDLETEILEPTLRDRRRFEDLNGMEVSFLVS
jgi:hypothetical protein